MSDASEYEHVPANYPPDLAKACEDPFEYLIVLTTGEKIICESVEPIDAEWIKIPHANIVPKGDNGRPKYPTDGRYPFGFPCARGITIAVRHIVAVVDQPQGWDTL
jgi:hypothetical protein